MQSHLIYISSQQTPTLGLTRALSLVLVDCSSYELGRYVPHLRVHAFASTGPMVVMESNCIIRSTDSGCPHEQVHSNLTQVVIESESYNKRSTDSGYPCIQMHALASAGFMVASEFSLEKGAMKVGSISSTS